jgi:hypothetical protein
MAKLMCKAEYQHGQLTYVVSVVQEDHARDWEREVDVLGEFYFVEYVEETLPSRNRVGGFNTLAEALKWVDSQFGKLEWEEPVNSGSG